MEPNKKRFDRVLRELLRVVEVKKINSIDISDFKYDDYEEVLIYIMIDNYFKNTDCYLPDTPERVKKWLKYCSRPIS